MSMAGAIMQWMAHPTDATTPVRSRAAAVRLPVWEVRLNAGIRVRGVPPTAVGSHEPDPDDEI